jgi:hypothetical protein
LNPRNATLLAHAPSPNTKRLCSSIEEGFRRHCDNKAVISRHAPLVTGPGPILSSDCVVLFCSENFGYMAGAMKDFFDRNFYELETKTQGLAYASCVRAGKDGTGTVRAIESIVGALGWRKVNSALVLKGGFDEEFVEKAEELGGTIAASLANNLY